MPDLKNMVPNLRDNIEKAEQQFKVQSFLETTEAGQYIAELPGIQDIVSALESAIGFVKDLINKILDIIEQILSFLNLNSILDALGIRRLVDFIFNLLETTLGFGLPIALREDIRRSFMQTCLNFRDSIDNNGFKVPSLEVFALSALLMGLLCSNSREGYNLIYHTYLNSGTIKTTRLDLDTARIELSNYLHAGTPDIIETRRELNDRIASLEQYVRTLNDATIQSFDVSIANMQAEINALRAQIESHIAGETHIDYQSIQAEIDRLQADITSVRQDRDTYIRTLQDTTISSIVAEVTTLSAKVDILTEQLKESDAYQQLMSRVDALEQELSGRIAAVNLMFTQILSTTLPNLPVTDKVPTDVVVAYYDDILSTPPGRLLGRFSEGYGGLYLRQVEKTIVGDVTTEEKTYPIHDIVKQSAFSENPALYYTAILENTVEDIDAIFGQYSLLSNGDSPWLRPYPKLTAVCLNSLKQETAPSLRIPPDYSDLSITDKIKSII